MSQPQRQVHIIQHPLVQHKLTLMRKKDTSTKNFRELVHEISAMLAYEITRDMPMHSIEVETPLETMTSRVIDGKKVVLASILRAGNGFLDGMLHVIPGARVGHIGLYRDPDSLQAVEYYFKMPSDMQERDVIVLDPMLATGGSATATVDILKRWGAERILFVGLIGSPEGVHHLRTDHPDVPIYLGAIDDHLNEIGYIVPGLGDAGDRQFGTG